MPVARIPKELIRKLPLDGVQNRRGELSPVIQAALQLTERETADVQSAVNGFLAAYDDLVPAFMRLFEHEGRDWVKFHAAVERLKPLAREERRATLKTLGGPDVPDPATRQAR